MAKKSKFGAGVAIVAALVAWLLLKRGQAGATPLEYICPHCGAMFATRAELDDHISADHPGEPPEPTLPSECIDGAPYCVMPDLYQCINGKVVLLDKDSSDCGYVPLITPTNGFIEGSVYESLIGSVEGVLVTASDMRGSSVWEGYTDTGGKYLLDGLPIPIYLNLTFSKAGYVPQTRTTTLNDTHPKRQINVSLVKVSGGGNGGYVPTEPESAEPVSYHEITGLVKGASGFGGEGTIGPTEPLDNVVVTLHNSTPSGLIEYEVITGSLGTYSFTNIPNYGGIWSRAAITCTKEGYEQYGDSPYRRRDEILIMDRPVVTVSDIYMRLER